MLASFGFVGTSCPAWWLAPRDFRAAHVVRAVCAVCAAGGGLKRSMARFGGAAAEGSLSIEMPTDRRQTHLRRWYYLVCVFVFVRVYVYVCVLGACVCACVCVCGEGG